MHINEMLNKKTYIGNIEPNPKEFGIWIKEDGTHMIYDYTNNQWVCECSGNSKVLYYKVAAGADSPLIAGYALQIKLFDTSENRFEYIPGQIPFDENQLAMVAPNFSFETDEFCIAFLPVSMHIEPEGNKLQIVGNTLEDLYALMGVEFPAGITRITEEEYWDNTVPNPTFTIGVHKGNIVNANKASTFEVDPHVIRTYEYEPGMTFGDWVNSKYNTDKIRVSTTNDYGDVDFYYPAYTYVDDLYNYGFIGFEYYDHDVHLDTPIADIVSNPWNDDANIDVLAYHGYRYAA